MREDAATDVSTLLTRTVNQLRFDFAVTIVLSDATQIRIESPFIFGRPAEQSVLKPPVVQGGEQLLGLFGSAVTKACIGDEGTLELGFDDDVYLAVGPDPDYEAWSLVSKDGSQVISLPGGGITSFEANSGL